MRFRNGTYSISFRSTHLVLLWLSSLPCASISDAQNLVSIIRSLAPHSSQFRFGPDNRSFVSTFAGK